MSETHPLLRKCAPLLERGAAAANALLDAGPSAATGKAATHARANFRSALNALEKDIRVESYVPDGVSTGLKVWKAAAKADAAIARFDDGFVKELSAWHRGWKARPLPHEAETRDFFLRSIAAIGRGQREGTDEPEALREALGAERLDHRVGSVCLLLEHNEELVKRLYTDLGKRLKSRSTEQKKVGKTGVFYTFADGRLQLSRTSTRHPAFGTRLHSLLVRLEEGDAIAALRDLHGD